MTHEPLQLAGASGVHAAQSNVGRTSPDSLAWRHLRAREGRARILDDGIGIFFPSCFIGSAAAAASRRAHRVNRRLAQFECATVKFAPAAPPERRRFEEYRLHRGNRPPTAACITIPAQAAKVRGPSANTAALPLAQNPNRQSFSSGSVSLAHRPSCLALSEEQGRKRIVDMFGRVRRAEDDSPEFKASVGVGEERGLE